ncbi:hypothetical protein GCM10027034_30400 [Ramlibacter solisilvae]|uniref:Uncharacterized protein n=1 Tax=Ramlibacter tataouinensis TaxID=94132 RepID=A0A127JRN9_9BURK|nr:hypothetical protein [Ramlibacter tataouinensis]AMO22607.1 hypothetical protein UC35_06575 [Ramlibacter tataouinensis]
MTVHQESPQVSSSIPGDFPTPIPLETIAAIEQVLAETLRALREKAKSQPAAGAGAIEYESWMRGARH